MSLSKYLNIFIILIALNGIVNANPKHASLVIDSKTGAILHQKNAGSIRYPASLTKLMTLYLTFDAIEKNRLSLDKRLVVSSRAAAQPASKLGLKRGNRISVRDAINSLIVKSANDASVVLAEELAGSEWQFSKVMNRMAKRLGMNNTVFRNSSGLFHRNQITTAYDMARLAIALRRDFGKYYHLFKKNKFYYKGKTYKSHNNVTKSYRGADGLKTGYIRASGFNLITSARRGDYSLVGIVFGGKTSKKRNRTMRIMLDNSFIKIAKGKGGNNRIETGVLPIPKVKTIYNDIPLPKVKAADLDAFPVIKYAN